MGDTNTEGITDPESDEAATKDFIEMASDQLGEGGHSHIMLAWHATTDNIFSSYAVETLDELDWFERRWRKMYDRIRERLLESCEDDGDDEGEGWKANV